MFEVTRLKLTAWYLLIIMLISIFFSVAFYEYSTREIERVIARIEFRQHYPNIPLPERDFRMGAPSMPSLHDLETAKRKILLSLVTLNTAIFILAGIAGYFLAGRTLRPIKSMIDEQYQFISSASHELRTPIATLRAEMEGSLLEKHITDTQARHLIKSNLEELTTLQQLTNKLLLIAKIHDSPLENTVQNISLSEVIDIAVKKVVPLAKKKSITITNKTKNVSLSGDKESLVECFVILLDNAIKYSHSNTEVSITTEKSQKSVKVHISDQGIGIPSQDLERIFDRFYRADRSRSQAEGYGLGLSIAKKIIEDHRGSISVTSKEGVGSTFSVIFRQGSRVPTFT